MISSTRKDNLEIFAFAAAVIGGLIGFIMLTIGDLLSLSPYIVALTSLVCVVASSLIITEIWWITQYPKEKVK